MASDRWYVTAAIPYVNADAHLGHALEFVQADTIARWRRRRGDEVRSSWGTDDNAAKNALAAQDAGEPTQRFVDRHAAGFEALRGPLQLGFDGFIRTSRDPRHRPAVERLWHACDRAGDLYRSRYEGSYCPGCERFYEPSELDDDRCPEHGSPVESVAEDNWFFRLSRYAPRILAAIEDGALRIAPEHRRNEVVAFLRGEVHDLSVSRPATRSHGWGIPVPGDAEQTIYVWFDALANYISALGFGTQDAAYDRWWQRADRRVHVIGKGITRFHAVFWPAFLLSAGQPLPTDVLVHEYVTADGAKISKSSGASVAPRDLVDRFGSDALRWWLLRDVSAIGDTDFRVERLVQRHDEDLANGLGNLVARTLGLVRRSGPDLVALDAADIAADGSAEADVPAEVDGSVEADVHAEANVSPEDGVSADGGRAPDGGDVVGAEPLLALAAARGRIDAALERLDTRTATAAFVEVVRKTNAYVNQQRPWELVGDPGSSAALARVLATLLRTCRGLSEELQPFLPEASARIAATLEQPTATASGQPVFPRLRSDAASRHGSW